MTHRGFTLLEVTIAAVVTGIMAAVSVPVVLNAVQQQRVEASSSKVELAVNKGRDAARASLRCVTVLGKLPYSANGTVGLAAYLHNNATCNVFDIDYDYPESNSTTVEMIRMHPSAVSAVEILKPNPVVDCSGTPPPVGCYTFAEGIRYLIQPDGTTDAPYRIKVNRTDGITDHFVVHAPTGTLRRESL